MRRISILSRHLTAEEVRALEGLAKDADPDCDVETIDVIGDPDPAVEDSVVLFLGSPAMRSAPDLEDCLVRAANGARRAVWVWPEGASAADLPPAVADYCYSYVPWDVKKLGGVVADDDEMRFELPTGETAPKVTTERNLCVEEETGAK